MHNDLINPDKVLIFDLKGPFAHFRKYYTNSSSLTYLFPPRATISGLIAGLLGIPNEKEKDKEKRYYEMFSDEKCFISVLIKTKLRKIIQTVNYIRTKKEDLMRLGERTQIPLEILVPEGNKEIVYRIYFWHKESEKIYLKLKERLKNQSFVYPPYMGITEFLGSIEYIGEGDLTSLLSTEQEVRINTPCKIEDVEVNLANNKQYGFLIEKMPRGFSNDRIPLPHGTYIVVTEGDIFKAKIKKQSSGYSVKYLEKGCTKIENIMPL